MSIRSTHARVNQARKTEKRKLQQPYTSPLLELERRYLSLLVTSRTQSIDYVLVGLVNGLEGSDGTTLYFFIKQYRSYCIALLYIMNDCQVVVSMLKVLISDVGRDCLSTSLADSPYI